MAGGIRQIRGCGIWVEDTGGDGPIVAMSHGLLWSAEMYRPQIEALKSEFRVIAWDHRGQGRSEVPSGRSVTIEEVTSDAVELLEPLGQPVHFVGLSMGGFVGMRIAARRPELVKSLALLDTAPDPEPPENLPKYGRLMWMARIFGVTGFLADKVLPIMCADSFLSDPSRKADVDALHAMLRQNRRTIYKAVRGVLEREPVIDELARITAPTTLIFGTGDKAIVRERMQLLATHVPHAKWVDVPDAGHTSTLEQPALVTAALREHLAAVV
ncbi:MAG: alpha/beta fold hydrolase [Alphaproteobacteria bacterium]|nr:alpha/beta fold hydrolase [Alphaproteobacteria bacterium]